MVISTIPGLSNKKRDVILLPDLVLLILRTLTISFIVLAIANFKTVKSVKHNAVTEEADIVLALDISRSMQIEDVKPNRLEALKDVLNRFIAGRSHDRFGIVIYAGTSLAWCPLTKDYNFLFTKLKEVDESVLADGTAIGWGLASGIKVLAVSKSKNKIIILLTDGENNTGPDPLSIVLIAKKFNIKVYTIGIGTTGLASLSTYDFDGKKTTTLIPVSIDEAMLKQIASVTGGSYFRATDARALQNIYTAIDKQEQTKIIQQATYTYVQEYQIFTCLALLFLLAEFILKFTLFRTWLK